MPNSPRERLIAYLPKTSLRQPIKVFKPIIFPSAIFSRSDCDANNFGATFSFFALMYGHIVSDFSLLNVYQNSHTSKPFLYLADILKKGTKSPAESF